MTGGQEGGLVPSLQIGTLLVDDRDFEGLIQKLDCEAGKCSCESKNNKGWLTKTCFSDSPQVKGFDKTVMLAVN
jgi:hypothetical protein